MSRTNTFTALGLLIVASAALLPSPLGAAERPFAAIVATAIDRVIAPGFAEVVDAASAQAASMERLCEAPSPDRLTEARDDFATLATVFSRVELYRLGPAKIDNRFERLFFWPDRRGRGLRQVQQLIADADETALDMAVLREKSVALQGLLALEFVLFGKESAGLATGTAVYRCAYGAVVAAAIEQNAASVHRGWVASDGHGALMRDAGPGNPVYRSDGEAVQALLKAASEQLEIVLDLKLTPMLGTAPEVAKPKAAPFWRSGLALRAIVANVEGVEALLEDGRLGDLTPGLAKELDFELTQAHRALEEQAERADVLTTILADPAGRERLAYAAILLDGAEAILTERMPEALGLTRGFNSLDGD